MKKILLAGVALVALGASAGAADLARPVYKAAPPPVPVWSWSGFYIGGHVGAAWGTTESELTGISAGGGGLGTGSFPISQNSTNGFLGGVTAGVNWQVAPWAVIGVEGDFSWTDLKGTTPCIVVLSCTTKHDWISTVAGRFGVTYDRALLYVKGGVAWSKANYSASANFGGGGFTTEVSDTRFGALFGAGVEYAFTPNWSAKIEYNYIDFGNKDFQFDAGGGTTVGTSIHEKVHLVKAGLNYKLNWGGPVVANY
jgi:outer membrane immunogenic protein